MYWKTRFNTSHFFFSKSRILPTSLLEGPWKFLFFSLFDKQNNAEIKHFIQPQGKLNPSDRMAELGSYVISHAPTLYVARWTKT
jgi:hypothetical protein